MKRSSPLTRKTALPRQGRIKPKARSASEKQRIYGDAERIAWMKRQPCLVVGRPSYPSVSEHVCWGAIECAHTENGGMGRKANADTIVPLCCTAHALLHSIGQRSFQVTYGVDLKASAASYRARWLAEGER